MKFTITGSLGNISGPLVRRLVKAGHTVTVIASNIDRITPIESIGAKASIGSVDDIPFLTKAFRGADGVYTMVPPDFSAPDYRQYLRHIGECYVKAIQDSKVNRVVNLSSIGAHLTDGTGPIAGLHDIEQLFGELADVNVVHLRASFFYTNFYGNVDMIKNMNIMGANYPADARLVMVYPPDVSKVAAEQLQNGFTGKSYRYIASDDRRLGDVVAVLGDAIGKPDLPWVEFTDEQAFAGMKQAGLPHSLASAYTEMGTAIRKGILWEDYDRHPAVDRGETSLEDFAKEFATAFK